MKNKFLIGVIVTFVVAGLVWQRHGNKFPEYGAPPYDAGDAPIINEGDAADFSNWKRPDGPLRVGLQVGHWKNAELPDELERIRGNSGTTGRGVPEWQVNLNIAEETAKILKSEGVEVDIIPATVPPKYWADVFVAIHADGSTSPATRGFKAAAPRRDMTAKAANLVKILEDTYGVATGMPLDPNVSRNMTGYYAFSWRRFEHATHPMTPAVIMETGFLTNPTEANMLINNPEIPAQALAEAILTFLR